MKTLMLPRTRLAGCTDLSGALHAVFGPHMLRKVHGPATKVGMFDERGRRTFKFRVKVEGVPPPIRRFFCGSELKITTRQQLDTADDNKWTVTNRMKLHFLGAEFFKLRPTFWLERDPAEPGAVFLGGTVRHDAVLPPPLNGIAENFMMLRSRVELMQFAKCLHDDGLLAPEDLDNARSG